MSDAVDPPPELAAALSADQQAREIYGSLPASHQREYAEWVADARQEETRHRRALRAVDRLRDGERAG